MRTACSRHCPGTKVMVIIIFSFTARPHILHLFDIRKAVKPILELSMALPPDHNFSLREVCFPKFARYGLAAVVAKGFKAHAYPNSK